MTQFDYRGISLTIELFPFATLYHLLTLFQRIKNILLGHVIIDLSCHKDAGILDKLYMKNLTSEQSEECFRSVSDPEPRRYVIPLDVTDKVSLLNLNLIKTTDENTNMLDLVLPEWNQFTPRANYSIIEQKLA